MISLFSALRTRAAKRKTATDLMKLDDHLLRDIGLTRSDLALMLAGDSRSKLSGR